MIPFFPMPCYNSNMMNMNWKQFLKSKQFYIILASVLLALVVTVLSAIFAANPDITEQYIARGWYRMISQPISAFFGLFPFSMAEVLIIAAIVAVLTYLIVCIIKTVRNKRRKAEQPYKPLLNFITLALCLASILYSAFYALWAWNFSRHTLEENLQYTIQESSEEELADLCRELAEHINRLRPLVEETEDGVMRIADTKEDLAKRADAGYENLAATESDTIDYQALFGGTYCQPQYLMTSTAFCYMGITGIFIPYTFEANVNSRTPDCSLPHTMMHEMAHQQGFPREDEANFVAFLACRAHDDVDFQYSGYYVAYIYSINALYSHNADLAWEIHATVDGEYHRDSSASNAFWNQFEGPVEEIATSVNNSYLQANGQDDGVHSYGRMVDWLLAERRARLE